MQQTTFKAWLTSLGIVAAFTTVGAAIVGAAIWLVPTEDSKLSPAIKTLRAVSHHEAEKRKLQSLYDSLAEYRAAVVRENNIQDLRMNATAAEAERRFREAEYGKDDDPDIAATRKRIKSEAGRELLEATIQKLKLSEIEFNLLPAIERDIEAQKIVVADAEKAIEKLRPVAP